MSDGYHTFDELYDFRREYNAALVNTHIYPCHKSLRHSDGELCFGGGWFIVIINLPTGQISNHYETKYWDEFNCEEREYADVWDGHTDKDVLARLSDLNLNNFVNTHTITIDAWVSRANGCFPFSDTDIMLSKKCPIREENYWCEMEQYYPLPYGCFPILTLEDSPKRVKVTIEIENE